MIFSNFTAAGNGENHNFSVTEHGSLHGSLLLIFRGIGSFPRALSSQKTLKNLHFEKTAFKVKMFNIKCSNVGAKWDGGAKWDAHEQIQISQEPLNIWQYNFFSD